MTGSPPNYGFTKIWGCKADGTGCGANATHDAACDAPYGGTLATFGVPAALLHVDGVMYAIVGDWNVTSSVKILSSTNYGQSWSDTGVTWSTTATNGFIPSSFINYGAGYSGGDSTYVYIYGGKLGSSGVDAYLARAPRASFTTQATWQYFTGTSGSPAWGAWGSATSVFHDTTSSWSAGFAQYFPVIGKYIYTVSGGQVQQFSMFESANPWGPWYTVYKNATWGNYGTSEGLGYSIVPSSISGDDKTFYMTFSGGPTPVNWDNYNLIKGTFVLQSTTTPGIPMAPANLTIH